MKQQLNIRIPKITRTQIDQLCSTQNLTPGEVVMLAVDRFFTQMEDSKMTTKITSINYGFHAADLFAGWESPENYDERASAAQYAQMIEEKLRDEFPAADVTVNYDFGSSGVLPRNLQCRINDDPHHGGVDVVEHLAGQIYQSFEWCVVLA